MVSTATPTLADPYRPRTLVWVDAREAAIARWRDGFARLERITSDVPAHHRATGRVRHDPAVRHGGGGPSQTAGEPQRLEHLARFVQKIADRLPQEEDLRDPRPGELRELVGAEPHRRTVGAYRWDQPLRRQASGRIVPEPQRVVDKPRTDRNRR
jgi:hypothetical protein